MIDKRFLSVLVLVIALSWPDAARTAPTSERLAEVNGEAITAEEIEQALGARLRRLEQQIYDMKRQKLEAGIGERLLAPEAAKQRLSVQALLDAQVAAKARTLAHEGVARLLQA